MLGMIIAMLYLYYMDRSNIMNSLLTGIIYADKWNCLIFRGLCRVYPVNLTKISGYLCDIYCGLCEGGLCQSFPSPHFRDSMPSLRLASSEFRVGFRVLSREPRYFETPILHIKPVEISPNFKSETTRGNLTSSPIPSLRLGDPGTSRPSPRRVWSGGTRTFESETRDSGNSGPI